MESRGGVDARAQLEIEIHLFNASPYKLEHSSNIITISIVIRLHCARFVSPTELQCQDDVVCDTNFLLLLIN